MTRTAILFLLATILSSGCDSGKKEHSSKIFTFEMHFSYPGSPEFVYDHLTGDISPWWDHSFSGNPDSLYIEAKPGGGFYELFDKSGNGVKHAEVIYAKRGEILRMEGPLGLSGQALTLVVTCTLEEAKEDETMLTLTVNGAGQFTDETPEIVRQVWEHFLWEQFKPYIEEKYIERN